MARYSGFLWSPFEELHVLEGWLQALLVEEDCHAPGVVGARVVVEGCHVVRGGKEKGVNKKWKKKKKKKKIPTVIFFLDHNQPNMVFVVHNKPNSPKKTAQKEAKNQPETHPI
jgi:hypothetical protein